MALNKIMNSTMITGRMKIGTGGGEGCCQHPITIFSSTTMQEQKQDETERSFSITKRAATTRSSSRKFGQDITNTKQQTPLSTSTGDASIKKQQRSYHAKGDIATTGGSNGTTKAAAVVKWQERKDAAMQAFRQQQIKMEDQIREGKRRGTQFRQQRRKRIHNNNNSTVKPTTTTSRRAGAALVPTMPQRHQQQQHQEQVQVQEQVQEEEEPQPAKEYYYQQQFSKARQHYRTYKDKYYAQKKNKGTTTTNEGTVVINDVGNHHHDEEDEEEKQVQEAKRLCLQVMEDHLMDFLKTNPNASYIEWLIDLHPDNTSTITTTTTTTTKKGEHDDDTDDANTDTDNNNNTTRMVIDSRFFIAGNPWQEVYTQITSSPHFAMQSRLQKQQQQQQREE